MSVLVMGLSHRTAPLPVLERAALRRDGALELAVRLCETDNVGEAVVLATCNRLELYADTAKFHGGVAELGRALEQVTGVPLTELTQHLYVHYESAAVAHLFSVACGLDSMAVGEQQILGQVRSALRDAQDAACAGRVLDPLLQRALRVGKRAHAETDLDRASHSLVEAGLQRAEAELGQLATLRALVLGAGSMSGLTVATLHRAGVAAITVANRTLERAQRLAAGVGGRSITLGDLPSALAEADLVLSGTGAVGYVLDTATVAEAMARRAGARQLYVDLALPRDVDPGVADIAGASVVDLEGLGQVLAARGQSGDVEAVRAIIAEEVEAYLSDQRAEAVGPTVVALRSHARSVVDAELARLQARLVEADEKVMAELRATVHRVVEKLLHTPTVRVKQLADGPEGGAYAHALRELFDLPADRVEVVSGPAHVMDVQVSDVQVMDP